MKRFAILTAAVLLTAGCDAPSASPAPDTVAPTTEAPKVLKPGSYTFEASGANGTIEVPGKPVAEVEALRALAKAPGVTYLTVKVDNRAGTEGVNMYGVSIFTPSGEELEYKGAGEYINDITPSGDVPTETYNKFIHAGNKLSVYADPKSVKEFVLVGPKVPAEFTAVTVYPTGAYNPVEAVPVS
jgi:hypothetical protein